MPVDWVQILRSDPSSTGVTIVYTSNQNKPEKPGWHFIKDTIIFNGKCKLVSPNIVDRYYILI